MINNDYVVGRLVSLSTLQPPRVAPTVPTLTSILNQLIEPVEQLDALSEQLRERLQFNAEWRCGDSVDELGKTSDRERLLKELCLATELGVHLKAAIRAAVQVLG